MITITTVDGQDMVVEPTKLVGLFDMDKRQILYVKASRIRAGEFIVTPQNNAMRVQNVEK